MRKVFKSGDIFRIFSLNGLHYYFQFIDRDIEQLNSEVIDVFYTVKQIKDFSSLTEINKNYLFYCHVDIRAGIKLKLWEFEFKCELLRKREYKFRSSEDYGNPNIKFSKKWWTWKTNNQHVYVGNSIEKLNDTEIGVVVTPNAVIERIRFNEYQFIHPKIDIE